MSLVVNIRGTGGSGKSTVVRMILFGDGNLAGVEKHYEAGRRRPIAYTKRRIGRDQAVGIVGHYETPCGGCDTLKTVDDVFRRVDYATSLQHHVLFEGIMVGDDVRRTVELAQAGHRVVVIGLTTPLEECLASIRARRDARGDDRPLDPRNTASRAQRLERHYVRLRDGGCEVERLSREAAYLRVVELLGA